MRVSREGRHSDNRLPHCSPSLVSVSYLSLYIFCSFLSFKSTSKNHKLWQKLFSYVTVCWTIICIIHTLRVCCTVFKCMYVCIVSDVTLCFYSYHVPPCVSPPPFCPLSIYSTQYHFWKTRPISTKLYEAILWENLWIIRFETVFYIWMSGWVVYLYVCGAVVCICLIVEW